MAYTAIAEVAQASGSTKREPAMKATSVSSWHTVTALPPARAGSGTGRRSSHTANVPTAARMSRDSTPAISHHASRPLRATVRNAAAMNSLSAMGSSTAPSREPPYARARRPSKKSEPAASATMASCQVGLRTNGNRMASGTRSAVSTSGPATSGFTCPSLPWRIASPGGPRAPETGGHLPGPRRRRTRPRCRGVPRTKVHRRPVHLQGRRAGQPSVHHRRRGGPDLPHHSGLRRRGARRAQARCQFRRDGDLRPLRALHRRDRQHRVHAHHDLAVRLRAVARFQPRHRLQGPLVGRAAAVRAAARDKRQPAVVPRHVDVLALRRARCKLTQMFPRASTHGPLAAGLVAILFAACGDSGPSFTPRVIVSPVLDSIFVGDTIGPLAVTYIDAAGDTQPTGPVRWSSAAAAVVHVDSVTGAISGMGPGAAVVTARANGTTGSALIVVSRTLDLVLLLDTLYLMPSDTFTVPIALRVKSGPPPTVWFTAATNALFSVDSASGRVTASAAGGPLPFVAHAASATDTVAD